VGGVHGFVVVSPSGKVGGSPAPVQLIARLDEMMFDQDCAEAGIAHSKETIRIRRFI
jgi:hypothetical protein